MLSNVERWVSFFDFAFKPTHPAAPNIAISEILKRLKNLVDEGKAVKLYNKRTRSVRVSNMEYTEGDSCAVLLIQLSDKNGSDPAFGKLDTGSIRIEEKMEGEGIAVSSHLVISTSINNFTADFYKTLVESVPGISKSIIEPFLNSLLKDAFNECEFINPATKAKCKHRPKLEIFSHGSQTFMDTLNGAKLHNVKLVSTRKIGGMDKTAYTDLSERSVRYKIIKQPSIKKRMQLLRILRNIGNRSGYDRVSISYSKDGKQSSLDLDRHEDASTKLFTKSEKVILGDGIRQCESCIHDSLKSKMIKLL